MAEHQVLFCPFCGESFEDTLSCPEHELALVRFDQLRAERGSEPELPGDTELDPSDDPFARVSGARIRPVVDERQLALFDLRFGRGLVAFGGALEGAALALGCITTQAGQTLRMFELARVRPSLWTLGLVSFTVFYVLTRRRTLRRLRGLRVLVPLLGLLPMVTLGWALYRSNVAQLGAGVYGALIGSILLVVGGLRLGITRVSPAP